MSGRAICRKTAPVATMPGLPPSPHIPALPDLVIARSPGQGPVRGNSCRMTIQPSSAGTRRFRPFVATVIERTAPPLTVIPRSTDRPGQEQDGGPGHSRYDCAGRIVRRGSQMSPTPDGTLADPDQIIANLNRRLAECEAELDQGAAERDALRRELVDAGEQQAATAKVLQVTNSSPRRPRASIHDPPAARATTRDAYGHPPRRNTERWGGRSRRIWILPTIPTMMALPNCHGLASSRKECVLLKPMRIFAAIVFLLVRPPAAWS